MNEADANIIIARMVKLWPKADWNKEQTAAWREFLSRFSHADANRALTAHFNGSKFLPKPADLSGRMNQYALDREIDTPRQERKAETWVQQLRRMHKIPVDASDGDVLVWWHITEVERSREVYGASHAIRVQELRRSFRRDWQAARLANGHRAECRVFGNSTECEGFWAKQKEPVAA